jgi:hypothetical protein
LPFKLFSTASRATLLLLEKQDLGVVDVEGSDVGED